ncbi:MAG: hypothetical protein C0174_05480 [Thermodesulfobium narugense]|nr:MAG: hypothetical protein C0174_05480 [Thermodesulfobium narugense]
MLIFGEKVFAIAEGDIRMNIPIEATGPIEIECAYNAIGPAGNDDNACPDLDLHGPINVN